MKATRARAKTWRKWSWDFYLGIQCCMEGFLKSLLPLLLLLLLPITIHAQFNYTTNDDDTITITRYTGPGGDVTIPNAMNGLPVTSIGDYAFFHCTSLTDITIPNSVTSIGQDAFFYCTSLTNVMIPDSVTNIGVEAFTICSSLNAITVDALNPFYSSVGGVLFNECQTTLVEYPGGLGGSYTIPSTVTSIGSGAFYYCTSLTNITIPNDIISIGDGAFESCFSLTDITIPNSVISIGSGAFSYCISLTNVIIPDSVTSLGDEAFYNCTSLTSVIVPNSVTSLGDFTFRYCTSLSGLFFQGNAPSFGFGVFDGDNNPIVYYSARTTGWGPTFDGLPAFLWDPLSENGVHDHQRRYHHHGIHRPGR